MFSRTARRQHPPGSGARLRRALAAALLAGIVAALSSGTPAPAAPADSAGYWIRQLDLDRAWQSSRGDGVVVGVVDTGVDANRPDLRGAVLPGRAFPELEDGMLDAWGHGTEVAVLIAGRGAGTAVTGIAPRSSILPAKLSGGAATANEAIRWLVDHGARVINLSLGNVSATKPGHESAFDDGLRYAEEHDVVVVAAAGNIQIDPGVVSPANRPGVIAVSAVDSRGAFRADISVQGPEVALAAPGVGISVDAGPTAGAGRQARDGTSYAAAIVSGVAALVRARYPGLGAADVVQRLLATADRGGGPGRDPRYGFGVVNPVAALTSPIEPVSINPLGSLRAPPAHRPPGTPRRYWPAVVLGLGFAALVGAACWWRLRRRVTAGAGGKDAGSRQSATGRGRTG